MKKQYEKPEINAEMFMEENIITTSDLQPQAWRSQDEKGIVDTGMDDIF